MSKTNRTKYVQPNHYQGEKVYSLVISFITVYPLLCLTFPWPSALKLYPPTEDKTNYPPRLAFKIIYSSHVSLEQRCVTCFPRLTRSSIKHWAIDFKNLLVQPSMESKISRTLQLTRPLIKLNQKVLRQHWIRSVLNFYILVRMFACQYRSFSWLSELLKRSCLCKRYPNQRSSGLLIRFSFIKRICPVCSTERNITAIERARRYFAAKTLFSDFERSNSNWNIELAVVVPGERYFLSRAANEGSYLTSGSTTDVFPPGKRELRESANFKSHRLGNFKSLPRNSSRSNCIRKEPPRRLTIRTRSVQTCRLCAVRKGK